MVQIVEVEPPKPRADKGAENSASSANASGDDADKPDISDERTRAFMKALNLDDEAQAKLARAAADFEKLPQGAAEVDGGKQMLSCMREGWWYESGDKAAKHQEFGMVRLQGVAKSSGDLAARACDWEAALNHYFSAMEIAWQLQPGGSDDLGTLHANCSLCLLKLERADEALDHAESAVRMRPAWAKAYGRKGAALEASGQLADAAEQFAAAERLATTRGEADDFAASRRRVDGSGDDGRVRVTPRHAAEPSADAQPLVQDAVDVPNAPAAPGFAANDEEGGASDAESEPRIVELSSEEKERDQPGEDHGEDDSDSDIGEPLGEPEAFEPTKTSFTIRAT